MARTMTAARFYNANQPLVLEEVAVRDIDPNELLVEVKACGLCGSDIHMLKGETPVGKKPITFGHEIAGVIAEKGRNVEDWKTGDRVAVSCVTSCGYCYNCQRGRDGICVNRVLIGIHVDGGLAQYVRVKPRNLVNLPDGIPFAHRCLSHSLSWAQSSRGFKVGRVDCHFWGWRIGSSRSHPRSGIGCQSHHCVGCVTRET
jgi:D-arabinose 1-dehydrogenase-like Zn-dependent alcohol dehydrogenase